MKTLTLLLFLNLFLLPNIISSQCNTIYVAPGILAATPGTKANPANLNHAINTLAAPGDHIKIATGTYNIISPITGIPNDITLEGGFDLSNNWEKTSLTGASTIYRTNANIQSSGTPIARLSAFELTGTSGFRLQDLTIEVEDAPTSSTYGISTYGLHLNNCSNYNIVRCQIIAGNASDGANGVNGTTGAWGNTGWNGSTGQDDSKTKIDGGRGGSGGGGTSGGAAGQGRTNENPGLPGGIGSTASTYRNGGGGGGGGGGGREDQHGGNGGNGGGVPGLASCATINTRSAVTSGGARGLEDGCNSASATGCVAGLSGTDGGDGLDGADGCDGTNGTVGSKSVFWNAGTQGASGTHGQGGQGGKGGGGGAGEGGGGCNNGTGAGGGGGGGGGQGGALGTGGYGAGSSYPVYLHANGSNGVFDQCLLTNGTAGDGGTGGTGGNGGLGRNGGNGGSVVIDFEVGCGGDGGRGGDGGKGGDGGDGTDGETLPIYINGTSLTTQNTGFNLAAQPVIKVSEEICAGQTVAYTAASSASWSLGAGSIPASITSDTAEVIYANTGRKDITYFSQTYTGFGYISTESPDLANAGVDSVICGTSINLYGNTPSQGTGTWTRLTIGSPILTPNSPSANVSLISGLNRFVWTISYGACCPDTKDTVDIISQTPSTSPSSINATNDSVCVGDSTVLTISGGSLGAGAVWNWYSGSCGGSLIGTGTSITVFPVSSATYYVRAEGPCDTSSCASTLIYVYPPLSAPTGITSSADTMCAGGSPIMLTAQGTTPTPPAQWVWYVDSCGGSAIGTGTSIFVSPTQDTTYFVRVETPGTASCAVTNCVSKSIKFAQQSTVPTSLTASDDTVCSGAPTTLKIQGGSLGAGAQWVWYSGSCGGTLVAQGIADSLIVYPTSNTNYYVRAEGACNTTSCVNISITVTQSSIPATGITSLNDTICNGGIGTSLTVQGGTLAPTANWYWYTDSCNGTSFATGTGVIVNPTITTNYFVRAESPGTGPCTKTLCVTKTIVVINPDTNATAITATKDSICPGETVTLRPQGGGLGNMGTWAWYEGSCGGTLVGNLDSLVVSPTVTTTYYLRTEGYCGTSTCLIQQIYVEPISTPADSITATDTIICRNDSTTLTINGGGLITGDQWQWYESSCGGIPVGSGTSITVAPTTNTTYFVRAEGASCIPTTCVSIIIQVEGAFVTLLPFDTICGVLQPITLIQGIPSGGTYSGTGVTSPDQFDPVASGYGLHIITYTYTDVASGCIQTARDTLLVESSCASIDNVLKVNTFSPNGDGTNDTWNLNLGNVTTSTLKIFNKYGAVIYLSQERLIQWDGTYQGKPLPAGSYFYLLEADDETYKGNITIIR